MVELEMRCIEKRIVEGEGVASLVLYARPLTMISQSVKASGTMDLDFADPKALKAFDLGASYRITIEPKEP